MTGVIDEQPVSGNPGESTPLSILIVEDEAIVADDLKVTLMDLGYTVTGTVKSGEAALETIGRVRPGLILMDIHLAGVMDGVDTAAEIRRRWGIAVIYLSAYADPGLLERARHTEPYGYLVKPFDERELHSVIEMAAFKYTMDRKLRESEERLILLNSELETRVAERTATLLQQVLFLQQLIDTIPAPVYYKDTNGCYLGCNTAFETYTGLTRRDIVGKPDTSFLPGDMAALSGVKDQQLIDRRGIQVYQAKFPHADHTYRDVIFKKATFGTADGEISGLIGVMIDVSDRIRAEQALRECEERYLALTGDQTELVFRITPGRKCTFANPAFLAFFQRDTKETVGFLFALPVHPKDTVRMQQHLSSLTRDRPVGRITCGIVLPDGTERTIQWTTRAFFHADGTVAEYQFTGHGA